MNNHCDAEWFGRTDVFNHQDGHEWEIITDPIIFPEGKDWKQYVDSRRLEITCGEAPYIVSRYDASTGELIPIERRIGILDRKLRVVNENAADEAEWLEWAFRAFQSVYGYEYQGDNLLIARMNLLYTLADYIEAMWHRQAARKELEKFLNVICWNFWQMDGLKDTPPYGIPSDEIVQLSMFGDRETVDNEIVYCKIHDWRADASRLFKDLKKRGKGMKFDYVIGNPPYQDNTLGDNVTYAPPVYHLFLDAAYAVSDRVELIHPARFLFNAGSTPKDWNKEMLNDEHFKVLFYEQDSSKVFRNTDIKGGVVVTYRDTTRVFGAIETFTPFEELNSIMRKVEKSKIFSSLSDVVFSAYSNKFTKIMHKEHPEVISIMSKGHAFDLKSNVFEKLPNIFLEEKPEDGNVYCKFIGLIKNKRTFRYIKKSYVEDTDNLGKYKVLMPAANGSGAIGEVLSTPLIGEPLIGGTESFISIGSLDTSEEAEALLKYVKSKFARTLLGILKITQHVTPEKWKYVLVENLSVLCCIVPCCFSFSATTNPVKGIPARFR